MEYGTDATREDIHDHIIGSGALTYSWYWETLRYKPVTFNDDDWNVTLLMDDPEYPDETISAYLDSETILDMARNLVNDTGIGEHGESANYKVSQDCRRQCELLFEDPDEVDFDADTADQLIQCIAYGEVVFS